ncbi:transposase [Paraburkholderia sediminicola]|nr:transposase [Paraburkholderia sediminicola]
MIIRDLFEPIPGCRRRLSVLFWTPSVYAVIEARKYAAQRQISVWSDFRRSFKTVSWPYPFLTMERPMRTHGDLTDAQWQRVAGLFSELRARKDPRGRPAHDARTVLNGVLWVLFTGAAWATLPEKYPDYRTCHRRFKVWHESGVLQQSLHELFGAEGHAICEAMNSRMRAERRRRPKEPVVRHNVLPLWPLSGKELAKSLHYKDTPTEAGNRTGSAVTLVE